MYRVGIRIYLLYLALGVFAGRGYALHLTSPETNKQLLLRILAPSVILIILTDSLETHSGVAYSCI